MELEHFAAGLQRQLTAHIRWLRTNRAFWGSLQRSLVHELQVSLNAGAILQWMVSQAMLYARGMAPPNHAYVEDPYPPLNPREATRASQRLVDEITIHCDILGRLMQSFSGEAIAHDGRVRAHLARMESSPIRRVRQRTEVGPGNVTVTSRGGTTSSTAMAPPRITNRQRRRDITIWGKWRRLVMTVIVRRNRSKQGSLERTCPTRRGTPRRGCNEATSGNGDHRNPPPAGRGSTASFSWRTLRPPRGTTRARGRGRSAPPRPTIPKAKPRPAQIETCEEEDDEEVEVEESGEVEEEEGGARPQTAPPDALPDDEEIERREERLRRTIGVGTEDEESDNAPLGFNPATLDEVQTL